MYFVQFTETAKKQLIKINKFKADEYEQEIKDSLKENPTNRGKFFGRSSKTNLLYFEKRIFSDGGLRFFYTVVNGVVIVAEVEYEGEVRVDATANKKSQNKRKRDLDL
jgi:hypothetical protein